AKATTERTTRPGCCRLSVNASAMKSSPFLVHWRGRRATISARLEGNAPTRGCAAGRTACPTGFNSRVRRGACAADGLSGADPEPFVGQAAKFKKALDVLANTLQGADPDITVIISDDQDEWFYEHNMPRFAVYWGDSAPLIPRSLVAGASEMATRIASGYGDVPMDVPIASHSGRYLVEYLGDHDFDLAHFTQIQ